MHFRDVVWGNSKIELLVHEPIPAGKKEKVSLWGWPGEVPSWNWIGQEGKPIKVSVFSRYKTVKLMLNGKLVGEKNISSDSNLTATFMLPYEPGELKAIAIDNGKDVASKSLHTSGTATGISLIAERTAVKASRNDLVFVNIGIIDSEGRLVTDARIPVAIDVAGEGELLAAGNACPDEPESYKDNHLITFRGRALVIVRPTGKKGVIQIKASSSSLPSNTIHVKAD